MYLYDIYTFIVHSLNVEYWRRSSIGSFDFFYWHYLCSMAINAGPQIIGGPQVNGIL